MSLLPIWANVVGEAIEGVSQSQGARPNQVAGSPDHWYMVLGLTCSVWTDVVRDTKKEQNLIIDISFSSLRSHLEWWSLRSLYAKTSLLCFWITGAGWSQEGQGNKNPLATLCTNRHQCTADNLTPYPKQRFSWRSKIKNIVKYCI